jgi:hypothetical protein
MIPPLPVNFGFSWVAMPVWQWVQAAPEPEPCPAPVDEGQPQQAAEPPEPVTARWVFKGYQWQPFALWHPFVNPAWDHVVDNDAHEIRERGVRQQQERRSIEVHAATRKDLNPR